MTLGSCVLTRLRDKLKPLYVHWHDAYGHQNWQDGDLPRSVLTHGIALPFVNMVLQDHVTN